MDKKQLKRLIDETLEEIGLYSDHAANLVHGTIAQESLHAKYIRQLGNGPARGIVQMEPFTHDDIWENYLKYKHELGLKVLNCAGVRAHSPMWLEFNLKYAIAMCRVHYLRVPASLPDSVQGYAEYWKKHYNTVLGAGTTDEFLHNYKKYC